MTDTVKTLMLLKELDTHIANAAAAMPELVMDTDYPYPVGHFMEVVRLWQREFCREKFATLYEPAEVIDKMPLMDTFFSDGSQTDIPTTTIPDSNVDSDLLDIIPLSLTPSWQPANDARKHIGNVAAYLMTAEETHMLKAALPVMLGHHATNAVISHFFSQQPNPTEVETLLPYRLNHVTGSPGSTMNVMTALAERWERELALPENMQSLVEKQAKRRATIAHRAIPQFKQDMPIISEGNSTSDQRVYKAPLPTVHEMTTNAAEKRTILQVLDQTIMNAANPWYWDCAHKPIKIRVANTPNDLVKIRQSALTDGPKL